MSLHLDPQLRDSLVVAAAAVALIAVLLAILVQARLRRLRRDYAVLTRGGEGGESFLAAVSRHIEAVEGLRADLRQARAQLEQTRAELGDALRHVAVVRYDAFGDAGGRLSFSAALLDDAGDGLVLTSINGRAETRTYAKGIKAGRSEHQLSPEEQQAVGFALRDAGMVPAAGESARANGVGARPEPGLPGSRARHRQEEDR